MGSSGSGNFTDYAGSQPEKGKKNGGTSGEDDCNRAFSTKLEDVSRCEYFRKHAAVPPNNAIVSVTFNGVRLSVLDAVGDEIGYLPTKYNPLVVCMQSGFTYGGTVSRSANNSIPLVEVDIVPQT